MIYDYFIKKGDTQKLDHRHLGLIKFL